MNHVTLLGNLASDPEHKVIPKEGDQEDGSVCTFRLAVNKHGIDHTDFFTVVTWNHQANLTKQFLTKGRQVLVEGRLHHSAWVGEDGKTRSRVEVIAQRVEWLGKPQSRSDREQPPVSDDFAMAASAGGFGADNGGSRSVGEALIAAELPSEPAYA